MAIGIYSTAEETRQNILRSPHYLVDFCDTYASMIVEVFAEVDDHRGTLSAAFSGIFQPLEEQAVNLGMPDSHAKLWSYFLEETVHLATTSHKKEAAQEFISTVHNLACKASIDLIYPNHNMKDIDVIKTLMHLHRSSEV